MSEPITEHVIDVNGRFWRETRTRQEIEPGAAIAKAFASKDDIKIPNIFHLKDYGNVGLCFERASSSFFLSIPIPFINLKCEFLAIEEGEEKVMCPKFRCRKDSPDTITVKWDVQVDSSGYVPRIFLMVHVNSYTPNRFRCNKQYLIAFDRRGNAFQLPMSNIYDHLELCCGEYESMALTHQQSVELAIKQFEGSSWNSDLYAIGEENTNKFFRFKPVKDGFETLPIKAADWTSLCQKRSVAIASKVVL